MIIAVPKTMVFETHVLLHLSQAKKRIMMFQNIVPKHLFC